MEAESGPRGRCRYRYVEEAMRTAADGDIIVVSGVITENVTLDKDVTLRGPLPDWNTPGTHMGFVQASPAPPTSTCTVGTVINVEVGSIVTIEDLNIRHGCATDGGGIRNEGTLNLVRSTVYDNRASASGGGIYNAGTLTVADSTLSGNAAADGGGIYNASDAVLLTVRRSTFAGNTASASGQSIANLDADPDAATIGGSILKTPGTIAQCTTNIGADAPNLVNGAPCGLNGAISGDPQLGSLRDNGGPTLTYAIAATSPALNAGYSRRAALHRSGRPTRTRPPGRLGL